MHATNTTLQTVKGSPTASSPFLSKFATTSGTHLAMVTAFHGTHMGSVIKGTAGPTKSRSSHEALLRINKAFNNEITRWLCHRFRTVKFCEAEYFFKYFHYGIARRALQWTNTITCRMENVSEGKMNWVVLYMVRDLWRNNSDWWTLGVEEDSEPVEWVVAGKSWSVSEKRRRPVGGWAVTLKCRRLTE
jgi:hypothetical protein